MMSEIFVSSFLSMGGALTRIFIIIVIAGLLVRKKVINQLHIEALSKVTVIVLLPSLVFSNTLIHFNPNTLPYWWVLPILGVLMSLVGVVVASTLFFLDFKKNRNLIAIASMQNAGYLVLPIGQVLYPEQFPDFALITFLFILGFNLLLWTLGKYLVTVTDTKVEFTYKTLITPPAVANIVSLLIVLIGAKEFVPNVLLSSVELLGQSAVPVATFILGATLGTVAFNQFPKFINIFRVLTVKYLLLPIITILILYFTNININYPLLADFLVIQSAAAPASGLIIQVRTYGGDIQKVSSVMLISYLFCMFFLPFWIALWHTLA